MIYWDLGKKKFDMFLSKYVPLHIKKHISTFIEELFAESGYDFEAERENLCCAIHPGGPKILRHIQDVLDLSDDQMALSYKVFFENGTTKVIASTEVSVGFFELCQRLRADRC